MAVSKAGLPSAGLAHKVLSLLIEIGLLFLSILLFTISFPSIISRWGLFPFGFIALVPIFPVLHRAGWIKTVIYGLLYGWLSYAVFNYWLTTFHPLAVVIVPTIYAVYFMVCFPLLKAAGTFFPRYGYLVQALVWLAYEYLRTLGFLGYPYGILGYTQYLFLPFIQIAEVTGIWGVTALVVFPSVYLGNALKEGPGKFVENIKRQKIAGFVYLGVFCVNLVFGFVMLSRDYGAPDAQGRATAPQWKVALVQHSADTWQGGLRAYRRNIETMIRLSEEALAEAPDTDVVVWSETCVVPGIDWHTRYRVDPARYQLVRDLKNYLSSRDVPFIFGNDDGQAVMDQFGQPVRDRRGEIERVDYNAVIHFDRGEIQGTYRKLHLVPFTEYFPYGDTFPRLYALMEANDFHFWEHGEELTVFDVRGVKISTPICFEDVFGYLSRDFVRQGAEVIVNLTNDSWSGSIPAEIQHGAMAVFRAVENRRSVIRSTNAGFTCTILPSGKITQWAEPFTETYLTGSVPVFTGRNTLYTFWGDVFAWIFTAAAGGLLVLGAVLKIRKIIRK